MMIQYSNAAPVQVMSVFCDICRWCRGCGGPFFIRSGRSMHRNQMKQLHVCLRPMRREITPGVGLDQPPAGLRSHGYRGLASGGCFARHQVSGSRWRTCRLGYMSERRIKVCKLSSDAETRKVPAFGLREFPFYPRTLWVLDMA